MYAIEMSVPEMNERLKNVFSLFLYKGMLPGQKTVNVSDMLESILRDTFSAGAALESKRPSSEIARMFFYKSFPIDPDKFDEVFHAFSEVVSAEQFSDYFIINQYQNPLCALQDYVLEQLEERLALVSSENDHQTFESIVAEVIRLRGWMIDPKLILKKLEDIDPTDGIYHDGNSEFNVPDWAAPYPNGSPKTVAQMFAHLVHEKIGKRP